MEALYGGESEWYKGKISSALDDGTYDVLYDDGDAETGVARADAEMWLSIKARSAAVSSQRHKLSFGYVTRRSPLPTMCRLEH